MLHVSSSIIYYLNKRMNTSGYRKEFTKKVEWLFLIPWMTGWPSSLDREYFWDLSLLIWLWQMWLKYCSIEKSNLHRQVAIFWPIIDGVDRKLSDVVNRIIWKMTIKYYILPKYKNMPVSHESCHNMKESNFWKRVLMCYSI